MGEAKRKRAARAATLESISRIDMARVAAALRKIFRATSAERGADCCLYALYGQHLLQRLGVPAEAAVGYAAWRVGPGAGDVIVHHPDSVPVAIPDDARIYHAWIIVAGRVLDPSTYDLPRKGALLDAQDGGRTNVQWHPDFLFAEKHEIASFMQVRQAHHAGVFYYERVPSLEASMRTEAKPLEQDLMDMLWMIYNNPDVTVYGSAMTLE